MKMKSIFKVILLLLGMSVVALIGCSSSDPLPDNLYTLSVYPSMSHRYYIGSPNLPYKQGWFDEVYINGALLVPTGIEIDPVFVASPSFGITAPNIAGWNAHPAIITGIHGVIGNIVGTSDAQSLTNKQLTMNNGDQIYWKDAGGVPRGCLFLGGGTFHLLNLTGNGINFNSGTPGAIYLWGGGYGTGEVLVLYASNNATALSPLRDSPTLELGAYYWDGGAVAGWSYDIIHEMLGSGATPKSQAKHSINGVSILRLENNNGTPKVYSDGALVVSDNVTIKGIVLDNSFLFDYDKTLVLNAPLWKLYGGATTNPFVSSGLNPVLCTPTGTTWGNQGRTFNGTSDVISLGNPTTLQLQTFTIEAWIKWTDGGAGHPNFILGYGTNGYGFHIYETGAANQRKFSLTKNGVSEVISSLTITDANWHYVAVTYNGTNAVFYKDLTTDTKAYAAPGFTFTTNLGIGSVATGGNYFHGTIGEVRASSGIKTATELQNNYNSTKWRYP